MGAGTEEAKETCTVVPSVGPGRTVLLTELENWGLYKLAETP